MGYSRSETRLALDEDRMPRVQQGSNPHRQESDAILIRFDLLGYPDNHEILLL